MSEPIPYDPNCLHCRRDAGKDSAGVTRLCETHKDAQLAAFQPYLKDGETPIERLERERHDNDTLLTLLAHSQRDAEAARSDRDRFQRDLAAERAKRCGTCADWCECGRRFNDAMPLGLCVSEASACVHDELEWPADHGCPEWRRKEDYLEARRA